MTRVSAVFLTMIAFLVPAVGFADEPPKKNVLVIFPNASALPAFPLVSKGVRQALAEAGQRDVDLREQYLDLELVKKADILEHLAAVLEEKFSAWRPNVVIPVFGGGLRFTNRLRNRLFARASVVFTGVEKGQLAGMDLDPATTGVVTQVDFRDDIELVLSLHPDLKKILVISDDRAANGRYFLKRMKEALGGYEDRVDWAVIGDESMQDLLYRVGTLPDGTVLFYLSFFSDADGHSFVPAEALRSISEAARVPVYSWLDSYIGTGVVGGNLFSFEALGTRAGELAARILNGERIENIPFVEDSPKRKLFDWRQLERWGIDETRLPEGSTILYRQPSVWKERRGLIIAALVVFVIQSALILTLLGERAKRRRTMVRLEESEERFSLAVAGSTTGLWDWDIKNGHVFYSERFRSLLGYDPDDELPSDVETFHRHLHPEDAERVLTQLQRHLECREPYDVEYRLRTKEGEYRWFLARGQAHWAGDATPKRMVGTIADITAHRRAEGELRRRQAELDAIFDSTDDMICSRDRQGGLIAWNEAFARGCRASLGVEPRVGLRTVECVPPEQLEGLAAQRENFQRVLAGESVSSEFQFALANGNKRYFDIAWTPIRLGDEVVGAAEVVRDITERKRVELALLDSHKRFSAFMTNSIEAVFCFELERPLDVTLPEDKQVEHLFRYAYVAEANDAWARAAGFRDGSAMRGMSLADIMLPSDSVNLAIMKAGVRAGYRAVDLESVEYYPNGRKVVWLNNIVGDIVDGHLLRFWGTARDITRQRALEQELRDSELRYRTVADFTYDWEYWMGPDGAMLYVSPSCERVTGRKPEEFIADPGLLERIVDPEDRENLRRHTDGVLRGESTRRIRFRIRKNGETRWIERASVLVSDERGNHLGYRASNRDVTERKAAEDALRERERELLARQDDMRRLAGRLLTAQEEERRRLARDLHDDVTQRLAVAAIDIGAIERNAGQVGGDLRENVARVKEQLIRLSTDVHALARQLHPSILDDLGLVEALRSECDSLARREGIPVGFRSGDDVPAKVPDLVALTLYRVAQEGLRNISKHACAERAEVTLRREGDTLVLVIRDWGVGFDQKAERSEYSLGFASMEERARLVGGSVSTRSAIDQGTTVNFRVPIEPADGAQPAVGGD